VKTVPSVLARTRKGRKKREKKEKKGRCLPPDASLHVALGERSILLVRPDGRGEKKGGGGGEEKKEKRGKEGNGREKSSFAGGLFSTLGPRRLIQRALDRGGGGEGEGRRGKKRKHRGHRPAWGDRFLQLTRSHGCLKGK